MRLHGNIVWRRALVLGLATATAGCALAPPSGPTSHAIRKTDGKTFDQSQVALVDVDINIARRLIDYSSPKAFADVLGEGLPSGTLIGKGDTLDIAIWEAPPAVLFGSGGGDTRVTSSGSTARGTSLPEQVVDEDGRVIVPFVGSLAVAGMTPVQVEQQIVSRLVGKAHQPQVIVRLSGNASRAVTVVGEVSKAGMVSLTPKGERLLDVLSSVGGMKQPATKTMIQVTRGTVVDSMPFDTVVRDPRQNIRMQAGDVVTALYQPFSFTALGASGRNEEVSFEATGFTLSQALGRMNGLQDSRADAKSVFIFRLEDPSILPSERTRNVPRTPDGKIPVIYRIDLRDPRNMFVARSFLIRDKDIIYASNSPIADIQKFINVIYSSILPVATVAAIAP